MSYTGGDNSGTGLPIAANLRLGPCLLRLKVDKADQLGACAEGKDRTLAVPAVQHPAIDTRFNVLAQMNLTGTCTTIDVVLILELCRIGWQVDGAAHRAEGGSRLPPQDVVKVVSGLYFCLHYGVNNS